VGGPASGTGKVGYEMLHFAVQIFCGMGTTLQGRSEYPSQPGGITVGDVQQYVCG